MRVEDLAVLVGEDRRACAVQHAGASCAERRRARRLDANQPDVVVDEPGEHPDRVRSAADACADDLGQPLLGVEELRARLADHRLQLRTSSGYGCGPTAEPIR